MLQVTCVLGHSQNKMNKPVLFAVLNICYVFSQGVDASVSKLSLPDDLSEALAGLIDEAVEKRFDDFVKNQVDGIVEQRITKLVGRRLEELEDHINDRVEERVDEIIRQRVDKIVDDNVDDRIDAKLNDIAEQLKTDSRNKDDNTVSRCVNNMYMYIY